MTKIDDNEAGKTGIIVGLFMSYLDKLFIPLKFWPEYAIPLSHIVIFSIIYDFSNTSIIFISLFLKQANMKLFGLAEVR